MKLLLWEDDCCRFCPFLIGGEDDRKNRSRDIGETGRCLRNCQVVDPFVCPEYVAAKTALPIKFLRNLRTEWLPVQ